MRFLKLRIQTKLMLAIVASVIVVASWVIGISEGKIETAWKRAVEGNVGEEVERYYSLRRARFESAIRTLEKIAQQNQIAAIFEKGDFSRETLGEVRKTMAKLPGQGMGAPGLQAPAKNGRRNGNNNQSSGPENDSIIGLVSAEGDFFPIAGGDRKSESKANFKIFKKIEDTTTPQIGHFPMDFEDGSHHLVEIVVAPVLNEAGDFAGAILQGRIMPDGPAQDTRADRARTLRMGNPDMVSAIFANGELFGPGDVIEDTEAELTALLSDQNTDFNAEILVWNDDKPYRVFVEQLNEASSLPVSYQVVLYPMDRLFAELKDLRLKGSGIGAFALLIGLLLSWWVARSFGKPIRDLAAATEEVRKGNFETRVTVRSKDELGELAHSFNEMTGELAQKERLREVLGKVSDETVAQALIEDSFELGGELREVSILFCDVRGFTSITEHMQPDDLITFINEHMTAMTQLVHKHKGVVDKFVGDEIMAIFGAPKSYGEDAANATKCAIAMIEERKRLNETCDHPCEIGIGVSTGEVVVGCMGSINRLNYTVLGERVNRGARLCSLAKQGQILVDETTVIEAGAGLQSNPLENVTPKGYSESMKAFEVVGFLEDTDADADAPILVPANQ